MTTSTCVGRVSRIIYLGAEALIAEGEFLGRSVVFKQRISKPYRVPELDRVIVLRRTISEAKILTLLEEVGVRVPKIVFVDPVAGLIVMEKIEGVVLRDALKDLDRETACRAMASAGREIGKMHKAGIAHGDVTTSNMILARDGNVYIVDLGLAKHVEDLEDVAVDIHLLIRVLESSHYSTKEELFKCFISGYREVVGEEATRKVLNKVSEMRLRGRYVEERKVRKTNQ